MACAAQLDAGLVARLPSVVFLEFQSCLSRALNYRDLIDADMRAVDDVIRQRLQSDVVLIRQVAEYIIGGGGKRLRPALVLLAAGAIGYRGSSSP